MAAPLDFFSKVNNSLVPVPARRGGFRAARCLLLPENGIICVQQIPGDLFA